MSANWGSCPILAVCLALLAGCRTAPPVLEPEKTAQKLVEPPPERRYDQAGMPKEALEYDPPGRGTSTKNIGIPTSGFGSPSASRTGPYKF
jgi:hypothetical protein